MDPTLLASSVVILLFSVILHEVMHGLAALKFGDHTAQNAGRLTLNPIPHIDPIGTILLPLLLFISHSPILFGWAKPVPINPLNFKNIRRGELATSTAGILANLLLATLAALLFHLAPDTFSPTVISILAYTVDINLILAVFNLIPVPPLDGSKIVASLLPTEWELAFLRLERYGMIILLLLWFIPLGQSSVLGTTMGLLLNIFHTILGV